MSRGDGNCDCDCDSDSDSDLDLLVTFVPAISALALGGLLLDAQELLGRRVDARLPGTDRRVHPVRAHPLRQIASGARRSSAQPADLCRMKPALVERNQEQRAAWPPNDRRLAAGRMRPASAKAVIALRPYVPGRGSHHFRNPGAACARAASCAPATTPSGPGPAFRAPTSPVRQTGLN